MVFLPMTFKENTLRWEIKYFIIFGGRRKMKFGQHDCALLSVFWDTLLCDDSAN